MAASSRCGLRPWTGVRKKWQDLASAAKKKRAAEIRGARATGGGPAEDSQLTPEEQQALRILSQVAVEGIEGGIDMLGQAEGLDPAPPWLSPSWLSQAL